MAIFYYYGDPKPKFLEKVINRRPSRPVGGDPPLSSFRHRARLSPRVAMDSNGRTILIADAHHGDW
jgi:hypothetical protein